MLDVVGAISSPIVIPDVFCKLTFPDPALISKSLLAAIVVDPFKLIVPVPVENVPVLEIAKLPEV